VTETRETPSRHIPARVSFLRPFDENQWPVLRGRNRRNANDTTTPSPSLSSPPRAVATKQRGTRTCRARRSRLLVSARAPRWPARLFYIHAGGGGGGGGGGSRGDSLGVLGALDSNFPFCRLLSRVIATTSPVTYASLDRLSRSPLPCPRPVIVLAEAAPKAREPAITRLDGRFDRRSTR